MDAGVKKTVLRMIPYGLYVLTVVGKDGSIAAATINWVTQASFTPPLLAIGVKADSHAHQLVKDVGVFALYILGKGQQSVAFTFFKPTEVKDRTLSGEPYHPGSMGSPILDNTPAFVECRVAGSVEGKGDHTVFVAEVIEAGLPQVPAGRPDDAILWLKDLGERIFYGG